MIAALALAALALGAPAEDSPALVGWRAHRAFVESQARALRKRATGAAFGGVEQRILELRAGFLDLLEAEVRAGDADLIGFYAEYLETFETLMGDAGKDVDQELLERLKKKALALAQFVGAEHDPRVILACCDQDRRVGDYPEAWWYLAELAQAATPPTGKCLDDLRAVAMSVLGRWKDALHHEKFATHLGKISDTLFEPAPPGLEQELVPLLSRWAREIAAAAKAGAANGDPPPTRAQVHLYLMAEDFSALLDRQTLFDALRPLGAPVIVPRSASRGPSLKEYEGGKPRQPRVEQDIVDVELRYAVALDGDGKGQSVPALAALRAIPADELARLLPGRVDTTVGEVADVIFLVPGGYRIGLRATTAPAETAELPALVIESVREGDAPSLVAWPPTIPAHMSYVKEAASAQGFYVDHLPWTVLEIAQFLREWQRRTSDDAQGELWKALATDSALSELMVEDGSSEEVSRFVDGIVGAQRYPNRPFWFGANAAGRFKRDVLDNVHSGLEYPLLTPNVRFIQIARDAGVLPDESFGHICSHGVAPRGEELRADERFVLRTIIELRP